MRTIRNSFSSLAIIAGLIGSLNFVHAQTWLELTGVTNGLAYLNLHNATNQVYEVWSKTDLLATNWNIEEEVWPVVDQDPTPFIVPQLDRTSLFVWARDWTDITSGGNVAPEWWFWKYFGTVALSDINLDSHGNTLLYDYQNSIDPNIIYFSLDFTNQYVNANPANGTIVVSDGVPFYMAVLINSTDFADAIWQPYNSNVVVSLNAGDGDYDVWIGLRGLPQDAQQTWHDVYLTLDTIPPTIVITNPIASIVSQPVIQLQGYSTEPLDSLSFDVANAAGVITNLHGYIIGTYYDENLWTFTTNWFQCLDVALTNGLNTITLHATDWAGNMTTTNVSLTLDYSNNTNPPALTVTWPQDGTYIGGSQFTFEGEVNDPTVTVTAQIVDANGETNTVPGLVEHSGLVWVQNLPLADGENSLTVTAMDAAGNTSSTNITVTKSIVTVTMDPISGDQLNQASVNVTGTVSDPSCDVWVNGIEAMVYDDGTWEANNVPVNATGTAVFDVEVYSGNSLNGVALVKPSQLIHPNDAPNNAAIDSQLFTSPQPPKVVLSSFWNDMYYQGGFWFGVMTWGTGKVNWISGEGGTLSADGVHNTEYGTQFSSDEINLPTDSIAGLFFRTQIGRNSSVVTATCWYTNNSKVIIVPQGQIAAGTTNLYLVRASALEFSDPDESRGLGDPGDLPLPPEWLQIQGQTLVNTGETNTANNSVWGETIVSAPAGETVEVTPMAIQFYANWNYTFDVKATNMDLQLAVDANRDGQISLDGSDNTTSSKPFHFWVNDSQEHGDDESSGGADDQIPGQSSSSANYSWNHVQGRSDYVNFFPVALCLSNVFQWLPFTNGFEYHLSQADSAVKFAYTSLTQSDAFEYLTNSTDANNYGSIANYDPSFSSDSSGAISYTTLPLADLVKVPGTGMTLNTNWLTQVQNNNGIGIILMEGTAATTQPLILEIWHNGQKMGGVPLYLSISGVEQMFRCLNLCNYGNGTVDLNAASRATITNEPPTNGKNLVFLHGYNVNQQQARGVESEMFKRFYWSGSKARFYGVTWNGAESQITSVSFTPNYHTNVVNALQTAPHLADFLTNGLSGETTVAAHSLGNMVVLSAISDCGVTDIAHYFMIDAAVPIEAVQGNAVPDSYLIYPDWIPYANRLYASDWWQLFPSSDARSTLTWSNRLGNLASVDIYNFYSSGEEVLRENTNGAPPSEVGITAANIGYWLQDIYTDNHLPIGCYGWQWQEMLKGRGGSDTWVGSKHGGWAFNYYYYPSGHMLPGDASLLEDSQLQTNAFFDFSSDYNDGIETVGGTIPGTGSDQADMALYGSGGSTYAQANRDRILSDAIPALTLPVGANFVSLFDDRVAGKRNFNMQDEFETGWPAARLANDIENNNWHHSDFDYMAYPYTHKLFDEIVNDGNLK